MLSIRNTYLVAGLGIGIIFGSLGGGALARQNVEQEWADSWEGIRVIQGDTLVPNPAAMSPRELAHAVIQDPIATNLITLVGIGCRDENGRTINHPVYATDEDRFPSECKEIHRL